jgi:hypothetical protein
MNDYFEKQWVPKIFLIITAAVVVASLYSIYTSYQMLAYSTMAIIAGTDVLLVLIFVNFAQLTISINGNELLLAFGWFKKRFVINEISSLEVADYHFRDFGGYGLRHGRGGVMGFVAGGKRGVKFSYGPQNKKFFFTTDQAEKVYTGLIQSGAKK